MTSNCTADQFFQLYDHWELYADNGILAVDGEVKEGTEFMEFYPDEAKI